MPTGFGQTRSTSGRGVYRMVFRARNEQVGRVALAQGHALLMAAINEQAFDVAAAVAKVREAIDDVLKQNKNLDAGTRAIFGIAGGLHCGEKHSDDHLADQFTASVSAE